MLEGDSMDEYEINIYEQIAKNIKKYRKLAGITQAVLAERVKVSHEFIRRIESRKGTKSFSLDTIWKISLALNVEISKIMEVDPEQFQIARKHLEAEYEQN